MSKTASGLSPTQLKRQTDPREEWEQHVDRAVEAETAGEARQWEAKGEYDAALACGASLRQIAERSGKSHQHIHWLSTMVDKSQADVEGATFADSYAAVKAGLSLREYLAKVELGGLKESVHVEWYTPERYIEAARQVMGSIDLDPASSEMANGTVKADTYFTQDDDPDGLSQDWFGNVWLNPPYGKGSGLFTAKLVEEYANKRVAAGVLLLNAYGFDAEWFQPLWVHPICFTDHRIEFYSPQRESGGPANGNIFVYLGRAEKRFAEVFGAFGSVVRTWP